MECFIDGKSTCERTFWNRLNVLANFQQKEMIMDGLFVSQKVCIGFNQRKDSSFELFFFFDSCITQKSQYSL